MDKQAFMKGVEQAVQDLYFKGARGLNTGVSYLRDKNPYLKHLLTPPSTWKEQLHADPNFTHEFVIPSFEGVFNHHTTTGALGSGLGGAVGAMTADKKRRREGFLKGMLAGGALGYGGSFVAPELSKAVNENLMGHVRRPVGRVLTNLIYPRSYGADSPEADPVKATPPEPLLDPAFAKKPEPEAKTRFEQIFKKHSPRDLWDAVKKDKPIYKMDTKHVPGEIGLDQPRDYIFRSSFDLPPHQGMEFTKDFFRRDADGRLVYNAQEPGMKKMLANLDPQIPDTVLRRLNGSGGDGVANDSSGVMGRFVPRYNVKEKSIDVLDPWDFDLHRDEKLDNSTNLGRFILDKLINKQVMFHRLYDQEKFFQDNLPDFGAQVQQAQAAGKTYL